MHTSHHITLIKDFTDRRLIILGHTALFRSPLSFSARARTYANLNRTFHLVWFLHFALFPLVWAPCHALARLRSHAHGRAVEHTLLPRARLSFISRSAP